MATPLLQKHKDSWAQDFLKISDIIQEALKNLEVQIEHVGSTSIPDLDAKPIIDIDIVFEDVVQFKDIKNSLETLGYFHNGDQGIKDREVFKRAPSKKAHDVLDVIPHHLYVCPAYSIELQRHLLLRDYLRTYKKARNNYGKIKHELAIEAHQDRKTYADLKQEKANPWIDSILAKAKVERQLNGET